MKGPCSPQAVGVAVADEAGNGFKTLYEDVLLAVDVDSEYVEAVPETEADTLEVDAVKLDVAVTALALSAADEEVLCVKLEVSVTNDDVERPELPTTLLPGVARLDRIDRLAGDELLVTLLEPDASDDAEEVEEDGLALVAVVLTLYVVG